MRRRGIHGLLLLAAPVAAISAAVGHDCYDGLGSSWSLEKKDYCCFVSGIGCRQREEHHELQGRHPVKDQDAPTDAETRLVTSAAFDCHEGLPMEWGRHKRDYCCLFKGYGCPTIVAATSPAAPYDCLEDLAEWQRLWPADKKAWCCKNQFSCSDALASTSTTPFGGYDCQEGLEKWGQSWAVEKRAWCCREQRLGCPMTQDPATTPSPVVTTTTTMKSYDCKAGPFNWMSGWSAQQRQWCCLQRQIGCVTPMLTAATQATAVSTKYDCSIGLANFRTEWTMAKTLWCCEHDKVRCPHIATASDPYACRIEFPHWDKKWSNAEKEWCCTHRLSCRTVTSTTAPTTTSTSTSDPYDCQAGYSNWRNDWSQGKRKWCCTHRTACPDLYDCRKGQSTWSHHQKVWCCAQHSICPDAETATTTGPMATSDPFDCWVDVLAWKTKWSHKKKTWCCKHKISCKEPTTTTTPTPTTTEPITTSRARGLKNLKVSQPFDCHVGLGQWERQWNDAQKKWCCDSRVLCMTKEQRIERCNLKHVDRWSPSWALGKTPHEVCSDCFGKSTCRQKKSQAEWCASEWAGEHCAFTCCAAGLRFSSEVAAVSTTAAISTTRTSAELSADKCARQKDRWNPGWTSKKVDAAACSECLGDAKCRQNLSQRRWCSQGWTATHCASTCCVEGFAEPYDCKAPDGDTKEERWSAQKAAWCCKHGRCPKEGHKLEVFQKVGTASRVADQVKTFGSYAPSAAHCLAAAACLFLVGAVGLACRKAPPPPACEPQVDAVNDEDPERVVPLVAQLPPQEAAWALFQPIDQPPRPGPRPGPRLGPRPGYNRLPGPRDLMVAAAGSE